MQYSYITSLNSISFSKLNILFREALAHVLFFNFLSNHLLFTILLFYSVSKQAGKQTSMLANFIELIRKPVS